MRKSPPPTAMIAALPLAAAGVCEAGAMEIGFVAIKPGRYTLHVPGTTGETQRPESTIQ